MDEFDLNDTMESEFIGLIENASKSKFSQETVEDSAKLIIGDDWIEVGRDIIEKDAPHLMSAFEEYANEGTTEET